MNCPHCLGLKDIQRNSFRTIVHPTAEAEAVIRQSGLERRRYRKTLLWQVAVYAR